jgi:hypothetical protein
VGELLTARAAHLNMTQAVVTRLATFSANAKNFCVTVVAVLLGIAFQQKLPLLLVVAALVVFSFAALDVYYLAQERRFRGFYREVANRPIADATQMDLAPSTLTLKDYVEGIRSFSTGGFYLLLLIVGAALLLTFDGRAEETGPGNSNGATGAAETQRAGNPAAVAPWAGADGGGTAARDTQPVRPAELVQPAANVGAERAVRNAADPASD